MNRELRLWVSIFYLYYVFFFLSSYHFLVHSLIYLACCSCYIVTDMPDESKVAAGPVVPTTPISVVHTTPIPTSPGNFLTLVPFFNQIFFFFVIMPISFLCLLVKGLYCALNLYSSPSPAEVALITRFKISSSSTTVLGPVNEDAAFFARFEQVKTNDLNSAVLECWISLWLLGT